MSSLEEQVQITSHAYWFKVVDMLQQNWALIDPAPDGGAIVWFVADNSVVFDQMLFPSDSAAQEALTRNGFRRYAKDGEAQQFLSPPLPPFARHTHPNGPIYSSGQFWRE